MSLDALDFKLQHNQEKISLFLQIPRQSSSEPPSSAASSEPGSPNPLADSADSDALKPLNGPSETPSTSTSTHASGSSLALGGAPSLNVKFAPLPELAPRKRRSNTPLGMAARGQLTRKRKGLSIQQQQAALEQEVTAGWTQQQRDEQRLRQEELAAQYAHYQGSATALAAREDEAQLEEEEEEEQARLAMVEQLKLMKRDADDSDVPFLGLGKTVKGFWKRVGRSKDLESGQFIVTQKEKESEVVEGASVRRRKSDVGRRSRISSAPASTPPPVPPLPLRPILASITPNSQSTDAQEAQAEEESGGVWEEEIGHSFPKNVSQTETIVEGRAIYASVRTISTTDAGSKTSKEGGKLVKSLKNPPAKPKIPTGKP